MLAREIDQFAGDAFAAQIFRLRTERLGKLERLQHAIARFARQAHEMRRLDIHGHPFGVQRIGHAPRGAHEAFGQRIGSDANQDAFAGRPRFADRVVLAIFAHRRIDAIRRRAQRELAQRDEIAFAEKRTQRVTHFFVDVNLAFAQTLEQFVRRQIDQLDFVGAVEHLVRHGLAHLHAGDLRDDIVEAFDVLHVDGRVDVDAGIEQFLDIHPAFRMPRAGMIGVREFVDGDDCSARAPDTHPDRIR